MFTFLQQQDLFETLFATFNVKDFIDIAIVTAGIYLFLLFVKQTKTFFIFTSIIIIAAVGYLSSKFDLPLTRQLFAPFLTFILVILVVVFQPEIRRFVRWITSQRRILEKRIAAAENTVDILIDVIEEMAEQKIGAIFVFPGEDELDDLMQGGFPLDAKVSKPLILSIFDTTSPGHDGAMLIDNNRLKKFGLHLPLADEFKGFSRMGTRHRAAAGITEKSDAMAIVISEERGTISIAKEGSLTTVHDRDGLEAELTEFLKENISAPLENGFWHFFLVRNFTIKLISVVLSVFLWFFLVFQNGVVNKDLTVPIEFRFVPQELTIDKSTLSQVKVTIAGSNRDIASMNADDIRLVVNMTDAKEGVNKVTLNTKEVSAPSYLSVTSVQPKDITVVLDKNTPGNNPVR